MTTPVGVWVPTRHAVDDPSQVRVAVEHAASAARVAGFGVDAVNTIVLAATELAENLHRHAVGGELVLVPPADAASPLVVLAVEWGSGRRSGWLSNIHLAARHPETGELVMVGKTFKGMTDAMLTWQTERFLELETSRDGHVVHVRPEQVVEIAFDGVQRSTRYPGGVALRFARVVRYREDKGPNQADTLGTVRAMLSS